MDGKKPVKESIQEYARGIAGGLLFSFPVLYTMEVWWAGYESNPLNLIIIIVVTFCLLLGYNLYAGMRPGVKWTGIVIDSVEEMGIGLLLSILMLLMLARIEPGSMSVNEILGKVVIEAMFVSIGVSIGTAQLGAGNGSGEEPVSEDKQRKDVQPHNGVLSIAILALCGSIIVAGNVAPTDEITVIAVNAKPLQILIIAVVSCLLSLVVTYFSDFKGTRSPKRKPLGHHLVLDTFLCYVVALVASAFMLWYFGRFDGSGLWIIIAECVVLGLIASLGASAGRLLIK